MNSRDALKAGLDMSLFVINKYISDLTDADLLVRPGPGCNHLAWQLGHFIAANSDLLNGIAPGKGSALPAGFKEQHSKETTAVDDPSKFASKAQYEALLSQMRDATVGVIDSLSDADLDRPSPERLRKMFPTVGHVLTLIGAHPLMHAGQFVVVRRKLGKPVVI